MQLQAVAAQRSIWIASAYFMPSFGEMEALGGAARDGVDVRVLVPSKYDHPWLRRLTVLFSARLLKSGVRLWEWRGDMMHAKTTVVVGREPWLTSGSGASNATMLPIDPLSSTGGFNGGQFADHFGVKAPAPNGEAR